MRTITSAFRDYRGPYLLVLATLVASAAVAAWVVATAGDAAAPGARAPSATGAPATAGPTAWPPPSPTSAAAPPAPIAPPPAAPPPLPLPPPDGQAGTGGGTGAGANPSDTAVPPTRPAPGTSPTDLLKQRHPLPEGVAEQVDFFLGGGQDCPSGGGEGVPRITGVDAVEEIPTGLVLCFYDFDLARPLTVTITPPGRAASTETLPAMNDDISTFGLHYPRLPGDPLGIYRVSARQGAVTADLEFTVVRARAPRLWLDRPLDAPAGVDVHLYLGGFPPSRTTNLHVYDTEPLRYLTSFPVRVDADGEAHAMIDTKPNDPLGCYGVSHPLVVNPEVPSDAVFCLF